MALHGDVETNDELVIFNPRSGLPPLRAIATHPQRDIAGTSSYLSVYVDYEHISNMEINVNGWDVYHKNDADAVQVFVDYYQKSA